MTQEEYEKAIESFLWELQGSISVIKREQLQNSLELISEIEEFKKGMIDPKISDANLIGYCFGIIDEYIDHFWKETISDGFNLYKDRDTKNK